MLLLRIKNGCSLSEEPVASIYFLMMFLLPSDKLPALPTSNRVKAQWKLFIKYFATADNY